jgi:hypothetical protein
MFHIIRLFTGFVFVCACLIGSRMAVFAADSQPEEQPQEEVSEQNSSEMADIANQMEDVGWDTYPDEERQTLYKKIKELSQKVSDLAEQNYEEAKETEQSLANRMLGGLTTAATGIGGMQLAQGLAEKSADSAADKDMDAYMATMRCKYGDGKSVPFGVEPVELPGGNNSELMKYRTEYIALAADLKERKTALGMSLGIEAEEILDKATMGLYDDENVGITDGAYASRYRAAVGNEKDDKGLSSNKKEAKTRMIAGGVAAGVGVVGGIIGNAIINKDSGTTKDKLEQAKSELTQYMNRAIKDCNEVIQEHKDLAQKIKQNSRAMQDALWKNYVEEVDKINFMPTNATISDFKDHKLCY